MQYPWEHPTIPNACFIKIGKGKAMEVNGVTIFIKFPNYGHQHHRRRPNAMIIYNSYYYYNLIQNINLNVQSHKT